MKLILKNKNMTENITTLSNIFCYKSSNFYILTLPKIASSWTYQLFLNNPNLRDTPIDKLENMDNNNVYINQINLTSECDVNNPSHDAVEFCKDWENMIMEKSSDKDFIFLMRDPIDKFITGIMQDVVFQNFKMNSPHILDILKTYSDKTKLDDFFKFHKKKTAIENTNEWWHIPNVIWPKYVYDVMFYIVNNILTKWFSDITNISEYRKGHSSLNLFLCYKILFNSNVDVSKIKILDINTEDIYDFLIETYKIDVNIDYKEKFNPTAIVFKDIIKSSMKKYKDLLISVLSIDILLYCDLHNHLYSTDLTPETLWYEKILK
jgi:hypothetical protein